MYLCIWDDLFIVLIECCMGVMKYALLLMTPPPPTNYGINIFDLASRKVNFLCLLFPSKGCDTKNILCKAKNSRYLYYYF